MCRDECVECENAMEKKKKKHIICEIVSIEYVKCLTEDDGTRSRLLVVAIHSRNSCIWHSHSLGANTARNVLYIVVCFYSSHLLSVGRHAAVLSLIGLTLVTKIAHTHKMLRCMARICARVTSVTIDGISRAQYNKKNTCFHIHILITTS